MVRTKIVSKILKLLCPLFSEKIYFAFLLFSSLLTVSIVKNSNFLAEICFIFLNIPPGQERISISKFDLSEKTRNVVIK